jgi:hypothetical protein
MRKSELPRGRSELKPLSILQGFEDMKRLAVRPIFAFDRSARRS